MTIFFRGNLIVLDNKNANLELSPYYVYLNNITVIFFIKFTFIYKIQYAYTFTHLSNQSFSYMRRPRKSLIFQLYTYIPPERIFILILRKLRLYTQVFRVYTYIDIYYILNLPWKLPKNV